jgi:signal transduction histidine kinase
LGAGVVEPHRAAALRWPRLLHHGPSRRLFARFFACAVIFWNAGNALFIGLRLTTTLIAFDGALMTCLSRLKIAVRIYLLLMLTAFGIGVSAAIGLWGLREQLMEDKRADLRNLMDVVLPDARSAMNAAGGAQTGSGRRAFFDKLRSVNFGGSAANYFLSIDYNRVMVSHPNPSIQGRPDNLVYKGVDVTNAFIEIARGSSGAGYFEYEAPKGAGGKVTRKLAYIQNVPEIGGLVAVGVFIDDVNETFLRRVMMEAALFALVMPVISALGYVISKSITKPLSRIVGAIKSLAKGDLAIAPAPVEEKSELGEVAEALDILLANAIEQRALQEKVYEQTDLLIHKNELLMEQKERAEKAVKAKSEFLSNMSHELRTPMQAILGYSEICLAEIGDGNVQSAPRYLRNVSTSGKRLLSLLNDLLDLSKMEAGKMEYKHERADMKEAVAQALAELDPLIRGKDIKLHLKLKERSEAVFDKRHIIQVLINLISNAIKFSAVGGQIVIELSRDHAPENAPGLRLRVIDEGPGIPEAELKTVFDKFIQSSKTKSGAGGTGLGLAICHNIIAAHSGRIWAENREPKGAIFTFVIPHGADSRPQAA